MAAGTGIKIPFYLGLDEAFQEGIRRVDPLMAQLEGKVTSKMPKVKLQVDVTGTKMDVKQIIDDIVATVATGDQQLIQMARDQATTAMKYADQEFQNYNEIALKRNGLNKKQHKTVMELVDAYSILNRYLGERMSLEQFASSSQLKALNAEEQRKVTLTSTATTIDMLNRKMAAWRVELETADFGTPKFQAAAIEVTKLAQKMAEVQHQITIFGSATGSIDQLNAKLAQMNAEWSAMGAAQKYARPGVLTPEAEKLYLEYKKISAELEQQGASMSSLLAKEKQLANEAAALSSTSRTLESLRAKAAALQSKLSREEIGTATFNKLNAQLQQVNRNIQEATMTIDPAAAKAQAALNRINTSLNLQNSYLGRVLIRMAAYSSVFAAARMVSKIREITAEFQMQEVALGVLIQDMDKASALFERIKRAAVKSPFEIKDLVSYTKQLSAYRVEEDKLFDVTMKLADVSAGLGVDMNRLILAYGQVKSASVLRGQELRQFTEAGIPMVQLLADKFSDLRGELVSTGEVFQLISDKAVPFSMVAEIFDDMTEAGGMFYDMQAKQSETLLGQWNNLKDSISIMYDEMGNSGPASAAIQDVIKLLKSMADNWRSVVTSLGVFATTLAAAKIAIANARVAQTALNQAEAMHLVLANKESVLLPPLIAKTGLQAIADKNLAKAKVRLAMASNLATAAFWKFTVAMMSNPIGAVIAAIGALVGLVVTLANKSKSAADEMQELSEATETFKKVTKKDDKVEDMIEQYRKLGQTTNRTAAEEKKFKDLEKTLLSLYPKAAKGAAGYAAAIQLINKARQEEKAAALIALKQEIADNEQQLESLEKQLERQKRKLKGSATVRKDASGKEYLIEAEGDISSKQSKKIRKLIDQINELRAALIEAKNARDGLLDDGKTADELDGWRLKMRDFKREVKLSAKELKKFQVYSDEEIKNFTSLSDMLDDAGKKYKQYEKLVNDLEGSIVAAKEASVKESLKLDLERAKSWMAAYKDILDYFSGWSHVKEKGGKSATDSYTELIKARADFLKDYEKGVDELARYVSREEAIMRTRNIMRARGASLDIDVNLLDTLVSSGGKAAGHTTELAEKLYEQLNDVKAQIQKKFASTKGMSISQMMGIKTKDEELRKYISALVSLWNMYTDAEKNYLEKQYSESIAYLDKMIARTKQANSYFKDILDMTGDKELAAQLTVKLYGESGELLEKEIQMQLSEAFKNASIMNVSNTAISKDIKKLFSGKGMDVSKQEDVSSLINTAIIEKDWVTLRELIEMLPEVAKKSAEAIVNEQQKANADWLKDLIKTYGKAKDYLTQMDEVRARAHQKRTEIAGRKDLTEPQKQEYTAAVGKKELEEITKIQIEAMKNTEEWSKVFENLDKVGYGSIANITERLKAFIAANKDAMSPTDLKTLQSEFDKLEQTMGERNPWKAIKDGMVDYFNALKEHSEAVKEQKALTPEEQQDYTEYIQTEAQLAAEQQKLSAMDKTNAAYTKQKEIVDGLSNKLRKLQTNYNKVRTANQKVNETWDKMKSSINKAEAGVDGLSSAFGAVKNAYDSITALFDIDETEEFGAAITAVSEALGLVIAALVAVNAVLAVTEALGDSLLANPIFLAIAAAVMAVIAAFKIFNAVKTAKANKEIERQAKILEQLKDAYEKLEKVMEKTFGTDYIHTYNQEIENLYAQIEAYEKQAAAERSKGKKADKEKVEEYEQSAKEAAETIEEMQGKLAETMTQMDVTSAAKDFANAWIDAYISYASTTDAMKEKFREMIQNMVVQSLAARLIQNILDPIFKQIDEMAKSGEELTAEEIAVISGQIPSAIENINDAMNTMIAQLAAAGINLRSSTTGLSGISKDIATASEESILGLAAGINTQNYYISGIHATVNQILEVLQGGPVTQSARTSTATAGGGTDYLSFLPTIAQHTAEILTECKSAAEECRATNEMLNRVIRPKGSSSTYVVKTEL